MKLPTRQILLMTLLLGAALAGCTQPAPSPAHDGAEDDAPATPGDDAIGEPQPLEQPEPTSYQAMGYDGETWPDLSGHTVRILAYDAWGFASGPALENFTKLTGAEAEYLPAGDSGAVMERAIREKGDPTFDVIYGVDNVLYGRALEEDIYEPYEPLHADEIPDDLAFTSDTWMATPVNHGYIAVNVDAREDITLEALDDLIAHGDQFVTMDPRTSTPGLGYLLATIATHGDGQAIEGLEGDDGYTYLDHWADLFDAGVLVTQDWSAGYVNHFTGGYGQFEDGTQQDRAIVTSYTTSPAYEQYYGYDQLNDVLLTPGSTFHQVQTMGIAKGTPDRIAAEAWIEYTLTDHFQSLAAEYEAIYPVMPDVPVDHVYGGSDPAPGTFEPAGLTYQEIDENIDRWLAEWTDAYEEHLAG